MKSLTAALFVFCLVVSGSVIARSSEPIGDFSGNPIKTTSGQSLSVDQAQQVIRAAAENGGWLIVVKSDGKLLAKRSWSNKHSIIIEILISSGSYSINYKDSIDMKYSVLNGQPNIHPYYNEFVKELIESIRRELMKLSINQEGKITGLPLSWTEAEGSRNCTK